MEEKRDNFAQELLKRNIVTKEQLDRALDECRTKGISLEKVLLMQGAIKQEQVSALQADIMGVPFVNLREYLIEPTVIDLVPEDVARKLKVMPLFTIGDTLTVSMADPRDIFAIDELRRRTGFKSIDTVLSSEDDILYAINHTYGSGGDIQDAVNDITVSDAGVGTEEEEVKVLEQLAEEAPVIKVVNLLILQAIRERASDIHIEPDEKKVSVRLRVDGALREVTPFPKDHQGAIISRIKILSKMDIAEKRKPQDGRIQIKIESRDIDLRVSTYPTLYGENVVIRILDRASALLGLAQLGFSEDELKRFDKIIRRPYGIILVTGPTGSGKTTTLYAALNTINSTEKNIITIEDPIEYQIPLIRQSQINPKAGLTFATGLRSILRQDPDIIMVGEIRDVETAEIAIHSALTGHLVLSTLHTNDAPGALTRLEDMGVEPFLITSSVIGILAQRLVRVLCDKCKESYKPSHEMLEGLHISAHEKLTFYKPRGCKYCENAGYKGRIGIFELLEVSEEAKKLVLGKASSGEIKELARREGMRTLWEDGLAKAKQGITSVEEVLKVTKEEEQQI